jgi:proteasome lid subunit RPN8/RPN11
MPAPISFSHDHLQEIVNHARQVAPQESCGLIIGRNGRVYEVIPIRNIATYPHRQYMMDPQHLVNCLQELDHQQNELLAIYHSHPAGDAIPSEEDVRQASVNYPGIPQLIIGLKSSLPSIRMWLITADHVEAAETQTSKEISFHFSLGHPNNQENQLFAAALLFGAIVLVIISVILLPPAPILNIP